MKSILIALILSFFAAASLHAEPSIAKHTKKPKPAHAKKKKVKDRYPDMARQKPRK
jgi:hypothetical protein